MADLFLNVIQLTRSLISAGNRSEEVAANTVTTVGDVGVTTKDVRSTPNIGLYFGIGCGIVVALALIGIAYLFLRGLIARKKEEKIALSDLRQFACQSRGRSCSPDFSPAGLSTLNSDESRSPGHALSPDWRSISPDAPFSPFKSP